MVSEKEQEGLEEGGEVEATEQTPSVAEPSKSQSKSSSAGKFGREQGQPVSVRAHAKYVRTSARKARLVCDQIRGKRVTEARVILAHTPRRASEAWGKLLESAIANAEHNHALIAEDLVIDQIYADEGPTLKRFRPRARGSAARIRKRTSHLSIVLSPKGRR